MTRELAITLLAIIAVPLVASVLATVIEGIAKIGAARSDRYLP